MALEEKRVIKAIIPAGSGTFALVKIDEGLLRLPVVAWAVWSTYDKRDEPVEEGVSGPLVLQDCRLVPAEQLSNFVGIRMGDKVETSFRTYYDSAGAKKAAIDPFPEAYEGEE